MQMQTSTILRGVPVKLPATPGLKGSCTRVGAGGGKSIVAIGGPVTIVPAAGSITLPFVISESGHVDRLFLQGYEPTNALRAPLEAIFVNSVIYNNDRLTSGSVGAQMFSDKAQESPIWGHYFEVNNQLTITLTNLSALPITVCAAWSVA
jgi:hypothetical protein